MTGRNLLNKIIVLLLAILCLVWPAMLLAASEQPVVILVSDEEDAYSAPIASFTAEVKFPVKIYNLKGNVERASDVMPKIINRSNCRVSRLPEASLISRSSKGPDGARRKARNAETRPQPPVATSLSASKLDTDWNSRLPSSQVDVEASPGNAGAEKETNSPMTNVRADTLRQTSAPPSGRKWLIMDRTETPQSDAE